MEITEIWPIAMETLEIVQSIHNCVTMETYYEFYYLSDFAAMET